MKKITAFILTFSMIFVFVSCRDTTEKEKSAYDIYSEAYTLTTSLDYQKFNLYKGNTEVPEFFKIIKSEDGLSMYCEKVVTASSGSETMDIVFTNHYLEGVLYQAVGDTKLKKELSSAEFYEKFLLLDNLSLSLPESAFENAAFKPNDDDGNSFVISFDGENLAENERAKLEKLFHFCWGDVFSTKPELVSIEIVAETTFDGYFSSYSLSFKSKGVCDGSEKVLETKISYEIFFPGNEFVLPTLVGKDDYIDGEMNVE